MFNVGMTSFGLTHRAAAPQAARHQRAVRNQAAPRATVQAASFGPDCLLAEPGTGIRQPVRPVSGVMAWPRLLLLLIGFSTVSICSSLLVTAQESPDSRTPQSQHALLQAVGDLRFEPRPSSRSATMPLSKEQTNADTGTAGGADQSQASQEPSFAAPASFAATESAARSPSLQPPAFNPSSLLSSEASAAGVATETLPLSTPPADGTVPKPSEQDSSAGSSGLPLLRQLSDNWGEPSQLTATLPTLLTLGVLSLAPALVLMTTSFVRIAVVFGILRQALGIQQLPSNQVLTSISLFMTFLIMTPVWTEVYQQSLAPYSNPQTGMTLEQAWDAGIRPVRRFMSNQIDLAGNGEDIWLFYEYLPPGQPEPRYYDDVPLEVLLPAFMLSELKTAFLIGFQIYLPFLVLDLVVASVTMSMGMFMLPPTLVSLPFKLLLFVLVDGWRLVVGMLLESFAPL